MAGGVVLYICINLPFTSTYYQTCGSESVHFGLMRIRSVGYVKLTQDLESSKIRYLHLKKNILSGRIWICFFLNSDPVNLNPEPQPCIICTFILSGNVCTIFQHYITGKAPIFSLTKHNLKSNKHSKFSREHLYLENFWNIYFVLLFLLSLSTLTCLGGK